MKELTQEQQQRLRELQARREECATEMMEILGPGAAENEMILDYLYQSKVTYEELLFDRGFVIDQMLRLGVREPERRGRPRVRGAEGGLTGVAEIKEEG